jgi:NAD(P)H-hydrate epimerase
MHAVVTPAMVKEIDEAAIAAESLDEILARVGDVVCRTVIGILGGTYGRRVNVLIGPGLNGADAASAARRLEGRGVRVRRIVLGELPEVLPPADLTLDGLFGSGLNRPFHAPDPGVAPVVSIDVPSGIDALTGEALGRPFMATHTLALMALKPGHLFGSGAEHSGRVQVLDIGIDVSEPAARVVDDDAVAAWLPTRRTAAHKWNDAVLVVAGSPGMSGAAHLACMAAMRTGAGYVHLDTADTSDQGVPTEVVASLGGRGVRADPTRFSAAVVGPGLGRTSSARQLIGAVLAAVDAPAVVDGDGLSAIAAEPAILHERTAPTVLTPHDGEFERLVGVRPAANRVASASELATSLGCVVLLKGPTTVVADENGRVLLCTSGDARLATAGTGDVLAGMIGALLARGVPTFEAAAAGAHLHGRAAGRGPGEGLIASDLPERIPEVLDQLRT